MLFLHPFFVSVWFINHFFQKNKPLFLVLLTQLYYKHIMQITVVIGIVLMKGDMLYEK